MKNKTPKKLILRWLLIACILLTFSACMTGPRIVDHAFSFDALSDSPDVEILDYRYGESKNPGARPPDWALKSGEITQATSTSGAMRVGDWLYVKWQNKNTKIIYQDNVDLRNLPTNIKNKKIYFIIKGQQLNVYLISMGDPDINLCRSRGGYKKFMKSECPDEKMMFIFCGKEIMKIYPKQMKL